MTLLALLLLTLGSADLARPQNPESAFRRFTPMLPLGLAVLALGVWGTGLTWWWFIIGSLLLTGWVLSTFVTMRARKAYPWPVVGLGIVVLLILAAGSHTPAAGGWWTDWYSKLGVNRLDGVSFESFLAVAAVVFFLAESSNAIVRMVLAGTGAQDTSKDDLLKGGRLLGPLERLFIFAMVIAGQYLALTAVVAAKSILRFPEISQGDNSRATAEYVLVGNFVSWSLALVFVPLVS